MSSLPVFEGRARPVDGWEEADWARSEESWEVKAMEVEDVISLVRLRPALGRGAP